jgi:hypothetical protein
MSRMIFVFYGHKREAEIIIPQSDDGLPDRENRCASMFHLNTQVLVWMTWDQENEAICSPVGQVGQHLQFDQLFTGTHWPHQWGIGNVNTITSF